MVTIEVVCWKYKPLKNNQYSLKIRVCKDRKTKYICLDISTKVEDWDFIKNQPKPNAPNKEFIEKIIYQKISEIRDKVIELKSEGKEFTVTTLIEKITNPQKTITIGELFRQHMDALEESKRIGYKLSVKQTYNSLIKFNKHLNIYFPEMDINWLKRYEIWLRKQDMAENTIGIRFRTVRMIYNLAIEREIVKSDYYPFNKYKVSKLYKSTNKRAITKEDIQKVINYSILDKDFYISLAINLFTFSYFMGGINFVDMAYLTDKNIIDNRLIYNRKKTSKLINLPMQERAMIVLQNYKNDEHSYLFPILLSSHKTEQQKLNRLHKVITKVNKALIKIGEELNLPIKLTTYVARHSYATVLKRAGVSTSIICESLGHSSEVVTQIYLDSFENEAINKALENL